MLVVFILVFYKFHSRILKRLHRILVTRDTGSNEAEHHRFRRKWVCAAWPLLGPLFRHAGWLGGYSEDLFSTSSICTWRVHLILE